MIFFIRAATGFFLGGMVAERRYVDGTWTDDRTLNLPFLQKWSVDQKSGLYTSFDYSPAPGLITLGEPYR